VDQAHPVRASLERGRTYAEAAALIEGGSDWAGDMEQSYLLIAFDFGRPVPLTHYEVRARACVCTRLGLETSKRFQM
jgi:hypothetical protein